MLDGSDTKIEGKTNDQFSRKDNTASSFDVHIASYRKLYIDLITVFTA